jgi:hypothetical protein
MHEKECERSLTSRSIGDPHSIICLDKSHLYDLPSLHASAYLRIMALYSCALISSFFASGLIPRSSCSSSFLLVPSGKSFEQHIPSSLTGR